MVGQDVLWICFMSEHSCLLVVYTCLLAICPSWASCSCLLMLGWHGPCYILFYSFPFSKFFFCCNVFYMIYLLIYIWVYLLIYLSIVMHSLYLLLCLKSKFILSYSFNSNYFKLSTLIFPILWISYSN